MGVTRNTLLTFDYELFQGVRSGTVSRCLLEPTDRILDILNKYKATGIFFIDLVYLLRLKEASQKYLTARADFELIRRQIIKMAEQGHYVFNHLQPHWLDAIYDAEVNQWQLTDTSKYAFSALTEQLQTDVFDSCMNLLNEILSKAKRKFPADGFRAGGLYIQPFSAFKRHFDKHGIKYDFSVIAGATGYLENHSASFNFTGVQKNMYRFSNEVAIEDEKGPYQEFALRITYLPFVARLRNSFFRRFNTRTADRRHFGDGVPTNNKMSLPASGFMSSTETFSIEMLNAAKVPIYLSELRRTHYLHLLSHPKLVSNYNLHLFDGLLKKVTTFDSVEFDFKKFCFPA